MKTEIRMSVSVPVLFELTVETSGDEPEITGVRPICVSAEKETVFECMTEEDFAHMLELLTEAEAV